MWDLGWTHSTISPQSKNHQSCDSYTAATHQFLILRDTPSDHLCRKDFRHKPSKTSNRSSGEPPPHHTTAARNPEINLLTSLWYHLLGRATPINSALVWYCPLWAVAKPARICFRAPPKRPHTNGVIWLLIFKINLLYLSDVGLGLNPLNNKFITKRESLLDCNSKFCEWLV